MAKLVPADTYTVSEAKAIYWEAYVLASQGRSYAIRSKSLQRLTPEELFAEWSRLNKLDSARTSIAVAIGRHTRRI